MANCTVAGVFSSTYGKFPSDGLDDTIIMEYDNFLQFLVQYGNSTVVPATFNSWVDANPLLLQEYADLLMYTLPSPRYTWYDSSDF
jgi:hypothetical protein